MIKSITRGAMLILSLAIGGVLADEDKTGNKNTGAESATMMLAQASGASRSTASRDESTPPKLVEVVIVTGTFIRRKNQSDTTSPIRVISAKNMDEVAAFNPADLIATLPTNNGSQNQSDGFNQSFSIGTTNVNLRGLGVSSTLTLINGRRQTLSAASTLNGDQFVDLNSLVPSIAIDRIEILEDGASSLYGSDAVAGVVNLITKKNFEGAELEVNYASTTSDSQDDTQLSALFGKNFNDQIHIIGALSYFDRGSLSAADRRDEFEDRNALSIFGSPGTYLVFPVAGPPTRTVDPSCAAVAAADDDVNLITAGPIAPTCQFDFGGFFSLVAEEERFQAYTQANVMLGESTALFAELAYAKNEVTSTGSPSQPILFPQRIPSTNPAAAGLGIPAGGRALTFIRVDGAGAEASEIGFEYETYRFASGLRGEFGNGWAWETGVTYSENTFDYLNTSDTRIDRFVAALNGVGGPNNNQFFNPLFGAANDPLVREDFRGIYGWAAESSLFTVDGHVTGELFELSAGSVGIAAGFQYRDNELSYDYSEDAEQDNLFFFVGNDDFSGSQDVKAVFVEADVPISEDLSVQFALRYEDFGSVDTTDPKIGFLWRATEQLSVRGTFGTSFKAPSIFQQAGQFRVPARIFDPVSGGFATISQQTLRDPSEQVKPQSSDTYNFGFTWDSVEYGVSASIDYWRFEYSDFITPENASALVAANAATGAFADQLIRNANTGALLSVTTFFRNAGTLETDGIDFSVSKDWETERAGTFTTKLDLSRVLSYDLEDPIIGKVDGLGQRNFTNFGVPVPELRGSFGLLWDKDDRHSANVFMRYTTDYKDENNGGATIDNFTVVDVQYQFQASGFGDLDQGPAITVGAKNLFDEMPPDVVSRTGYDALTHSPLGRQVYLSVKQTF